MPTRVLIAEPDPALLQHFREALWRHSFEVATAMDGVECVEQLRSWKPHVLVLEPELPMGGGVGVMARMHERDDVPLVPVIVITSGLRSRGQDSVRAVLQFPIDDYHVKPVDPVDLVKWVHALLGQEKHQGQGIRAAVQHEAELPQVALEEGVQRQARRLSYDP